MAAEEESDLEQTVRRVVVDVLSEVSDELTSPGGEPPANGSGARSSTRRFAQGAAVSPRAGTSPNGSVPPEVSSALQAVLRQVSPDQAHALATLFEAVAEGAEEGEDDSESDAESLSNVELGSVREAKAQGESIARARKGRLETIIKLLRKSKKVYRAAVRAAKRGKGSFNKWVDSLSSFNPLKYAIKALPDVVLYELINWLADQSVAADARAASASDEDEIEQVVRRVLSEALTEPGGQSAAA